jgi:hypothetical protein
LKRSMLLLSACSSNTAVFFISTPEWESMGGGRELERELSAVVREHGYSMRMVVQGILEPFGDRLSRELSRGRASVAIVSPLFSDEAVTVASRFPAVSFVMLGGTAPSGSEPGFLRLRFDRRDAFQSMGFVTALSLGESATAGQPKGRVGILLLQARSGGDEEIVAFRLGLSEAGDTEMPIVRELQEPVDKAAVQKAVTEMRAQAVEIFLPRLGELNSTCLEALKSSGGSAVTEDWEGSRAYEQQVFLSVEEDIVGGVGKCLTGIGGEDRIVYGPVRVVCGKARTIPGQAQGRVSCR